MGRAKLTNSDPSKNWSAELKQAATKQIKFNTDGKPVIIAMADSDSEARLKKLLVSVPVVQIKDNYEEQLAELLLSRNAQLYRANKEVQTNSIASFLADHYQGIEPWQAGSWVYYPWSGKLVHVLEETLFNETRTIRNRELITSEEQAKFYNFKVGCLGMSVGSSAAVSLVMQGGSGRLKIADSAVISGSNLNRIRTGVDNVGEVKSTVIAHQLYEMNPYLEVMQAPKSITAETLEDFFQNPWKLDCIIDEIDDLEIKVRLRMEARKLGIPVIMATDLGDDVMLDVERYDLDPSLPLFHGLAGDIEQVIGRKDMTQRQWLKYANMIIGNHNVPLRMQQSLMLIGQKLPTQPQLGGTAQIAGAVVAYAVRMLALGQPLKAGRNIISLDAALLKGHKSFSNKRKHRRHTKALEKALGSI